MSKHLVVVLNREIPPGRLMSAVGHMMLGLGVRLPEGKMPSISIYRANNGDTRILREQAYSRWLLNNNHIIYSDFAHTTTDGTARDHHTQTAKIHELDICYFGVAFGAESSEVEALMTTLNTDYYESFNTTLSYTTHADFDFLPQSEAHHDFVEDDKASTISIGVQRGLSSGDAICALTQATLALSRDCKVKPSLRLHDYLDASETIHPGMSEYGCVVLKAKKASTLDKIDKEGLKALTAFGANSNAIAMFGLRDAVKALTKQFSVWGEIPKDIELKKGPGLFVNGQFNDSNNFNALTK